MTVELDHLFIFTRVGAPEVDQLLKLGLTEGTRNIHPGQGTACRRVFFPNAYLEFVWVHNEPEAQSEMVKPLHLWERWKYHQTTASPFGLILRPTQPTTEPVILPFESWAYGPSFFQPLHLEVAENSADTAEPLLFYMSFGKRPDSYPAERKPPLDHAMGVRAVTGLRITLPGVQSLSSVLEGVEQVTWVEFILGEAHLAEVIFDQEQRGKVKDFRPELPLIFRW